MPKTNKNTKTNVNESANNNSPEKKIMSKDEVVNHIIAECKKRVEALNRDSSFITSSTLMSDLYPETEGQKLANGHMTGEVGKLETMVQLELELLQDKFMLPCETFFDETMTIDKFADILLEAMKKEGTGDNLQDKFKNFFQEEETSEDEKSDDEIDSEESIEEEE